MAGKRPPMRPMGRVTRMAVRRRRGVTLKAKATWLKLCPVEGRGEVAVEDQVARRPPMAPPARARNSTAQPASGMGW
jgi:hypothetical protein